MALIQLTKGKVDLENKTLINGCIYTYKCTLIEGLF